MISGRQRVRPDELLNRWVVPLDRKIDFLTLAGGRKIEMPFEMLVVFASNLDPAQLLDAAFLRRIQTKIFVGEVSDEEFCEIFRRVATERKVECDESVAHTLIDFVHGTLKQELRSTFIRGTSSTRFAGRPSMKAKTANQSCHRHAGD